MSHITPMLLPALKSLLFWPHGTRGIKVASLATVHINASLPCLSGRATRARPNCMGSPGSTKVGEGTNIGTAVCITNGGDKPCVPSVYLQFALRRLSRWMEKKIRDSRTGVISLTACSFMMPMLKAVRNAPQSAESFQQLSSA